MDCPIRFKFRRTLNRFRLRCDARTPTISLAVPALVIDRVGGWIFSAGFVHQFSHCGKHVCHTRQFSVRNVVVRLHVSILRAGD